MTQLDLLGYRAEEPASVEEPSIEERWRAFDAANPHVLDELERLGRERLDEGAKYVSIKALWEEARVALRVRKLGAYALNNDFTALYARALIARVPGLAGAIRTRKRKGEP